MQSKDKRPTCKQCGFAFTPEEDSAVTDTCAKCWEDKMCELYPRRRQRKAERMPRWTLSVDMDVRRPDPYPWCEYPRFRDYTSFHQRSRWHKG